MMKRGGYTRQAGVPCYSCGKEFQMSQLTNHEILCKGGINQERQSSPQKEPHIVKRNQFPQLSDNKSSPELIACRNCGQKMLEENMHIHSRSCQSNFQNTSSKSHKTANIFAPLKEKLISCGVCLNRVPASQVQKHELECRQNSLAKNPKSRITGGGGRGGGGATYNPSSSIKKPIKKQFDPPEYIPSTPIIRPLTLVCYICGREYGTKSLAIHLKSCQKKWDLQQDNNPTNERRNMPRPPPGFQQLIEKESITKKDIYNYNNKAFDQYNYDVLVPCTNCGRTFKPESLIPHQKSCKVGNPLKPLSNAQKEYQAESQYAMQNGHQDLVPCNKCGRKFASDRIDKHESVCNPGPTKQAIRKQKQLDQKQKKIEQNDRKYENVQQPNWRQEHEQFQSQMKYMRAVSNVEQKGGNIRNLPPPPQTQNSNMKQCPHCMRRFNQEAAVRHIQVCQNVISKPKPPPSVISSIQYQKPSNLNNNQIKFSNQRANSSNNSKYNKMQFDDDYDDDERYSYTSPHKQQPTYKIINSNVPSFSTKVTHTKIQPSNVSSRDSWMKPMNSKQQKTHDNLYGIGAFTSPQINNNSVFPAPKGQGGLR